MRFIFLNPQNSPFFGATLLNYVSKIHSTIRYKYLIDYFLSKNNKIYIFITPSASSLPEYISRYFPIKVEIFFWSLINHLNPFKICLLHDPKDLQPDDVLFALTFRNFDLADHFPLPRKHQFVEIFHITHFSHFTKLLSNNLKKLNPDIILAESNLNKSSSFFKNFFKFYQKNVYTLPFVFEKRFHSYNPFDKRINKCLATGSLAITNELNNSAQFKDFEEYFKVNTLYPLRKEIFENKDKLIEYIDSYISKVFDHKPKMPSPDDTIFKKFYKSISNGISVSRHKYYKFDIVQKYNEYKMFIIPEEIYDLPAIGFVEGMACGSAYIGKIHPMYTDLGLKPNVHYIGHDGSLKDLRHKIRYFQKHPQQLQKIAQAGYDFVTAKFNGLKVAEIFFKDIENFQKNKKQKIVSSFVIAN